LANHLAEKLIADPHWAYLALEAAKLLPYKDTLFDERTQHFRQEKQELAIRAAPLASGFLNALRALLLPQHVSVILDKI
jgi:hypothetical protein